MGRSLGIDLGSKRVGIALSDISNIIASPLKTLTFKNQNDLLNQLRTLIAEYDVKNIVLGLPMSMSGIDSVQTKAVRDLIDNQNLNVDIEIDGGINFENCSKVKNAGANILVSGSTIFKENKGDLKKNIEILRNN